MCRSHERPLRQQDLADAFPVSGMQLVIGLERTEVPFIFISSAQPQKAGQGHFFLGERDGTDIRALINNRH